ncbi:hypothetical protein L861_15695 [Litchfieldella anticariensis FP35 = DSM 16096]|uniref:Uncharacterized protein n=1 Tax=Litchfieldella anticariensis (strain DSM 16096 / CECT 5854 / CIP 108499 / LMG 22089 / FP35) TaxID=1121939 RepID=S2KJ12_LITA3|nr:hypothetical protein [Halomonas anticariensis]EPC02152.1 hypothetical protein L861_15695 [Halomonas anticariensis FP35 = DSM 16096]
MKLMTLTATLVVGLLAAGTVLALDSSYMDQRSARLHLMVGESDVMRVSTDIPLVTGSSYWENRSANLNRTTSGIANPQDEKQSVRGLILVSDPYAWWR